MVKLICRLVFGDHRGQALPLESWLLTIEETSPVILNKMYIHMLDHLSLAMTRNATFISSNCSKLSFTNTILTKNIESYQETTNGTKANGEETAEIRIRDKSSNNWHEISSCSPEKDYILAFC